MKISLPDTISHHTWLLLLVAVLLTAPLLSGCSGTSAHNAAYPMAAMADMPELVQHSPDHVSDAYRFAVANPDALKNVPCYCGCAPSGHTSNYSCYVKEAKPSGEVVFDLHAVACTICLDITQDVMKMTADGKSPPDIRQAIDQTYSRFGPSNMPAAE